jgi:hypothetical protein
MEVFRQQMINQSKTNQLIMVNSSKGDFIDNSTFMR